MALLAASRGVERAVKIALGWGVTVNIRTLTGKQIYSFERNKLPAERGMESGPTSAGLIGLPTDIGLDVCGADVADWRFKLRSGWKQRKSGLTFEGYGLECM